MKKIIVVAIVFILLGFDSQKDPAFNTGEWFKFRIHYGLVTAGYATLEVSEAQIGSKKVFHAVGKGYTTGMSKLFFKVEDNYESYFDKQTGKPYQFVRQVNEGGYIINQIGNFNQDKNTVLVKNFRDNTEKSFATPEKVQDIISTFYYLRNYPNVDKLKPGEAVNVDMFLDDKIIPFKLKFIGRENISTKFGTVPCMLFRPLVLSGRIFKEQESVTVWISDDDNKIPVRIKADLTVGSLKADLEGFKGLSNQFTTKQDE